MSESPSPASGRVRDARTRPVGRLAALAPYAVAVAAVAVAAGVTKLLDTIGSSSIYPMFLGAVLVAAWFGGAWAGLLATALGALAAWTVFFEPEWSFRIADRGQIVGLVLFGAVSVLVIALAARMQRARLEAERAGRRAAFLADAGETIAASLDYETTLARVARLAVPAIADWCAVDIVEPDEAPRRLAIAHVDPARQRWAREFERRFPDDPDASAGLSAVLRTGRPELIPEITDRMLAEAAPDPEARALLRTVGFTSYMCVPLVARDRILGGITFASADPTRRFGDEDLALAEELARRAASAVDNARLYQGEQAARAEADHAGGLLAQVQAVTDVALAYLDLGPLLRELLGRIATLIEADSAGILLLEGDDLVVRAAVGLEGEENRHLRVPVGAGFAGRVAADRRPRVATGEDATAMLLSPVLRRAGVRAVAGVPLLIEERLIGVLLVASLRERTFEEGEVPLLELVAVRAAIAIDHARAYEGQQRARARVDRLQRVTAALSASLTPAGVAQVVIREALDGLGAEAGAVYLVAADGAALEYLGALGYRAGALEPYRRVPLDAPLPLAEAVRRGEPVWFESGEDLVRRYPSLAGQARGTAGVSLPLLFEGRPVGGMALSLAPAAQLDREDREDLMAMGRLCGAALDRARLYEAEREARAAAQAAERRAAFLAEVGVTLDATIGARERLARLARLVVPRLADLCLVDTIGVEGELREVAVAHVHPDQEHLMRRLRERYPPDPEGPHPLAQVLRTGRPDVRPELDDGYLAGVTRSPEHLDLVRRLAFRSHVVVPLVARGRIIGALSLVSTTESGRRYQADDLPFVEEVARRAALALDNARLYEEQRSIAHALQESLLPPALPDVPGVDIAARYLPMGEGNEVGGDFYDVFELGDAWAAVIGDACGKGAEAAALTGLVRYTMRAVPDEASPSEVLARVNEAIQRQRGDTRFCTAAYVRLEPDEAGISATLACGGHPLGLLLHRSGRVETIGAPGSLLGPFPDVRLTDVAHRVAPGQTLLLYTDGVIEARRNGVMFGEQRLRRVLSQCAGLTAQALAERIVRAAVDFQGGVAADDLAVLVLRAARPDDGAPEPSRTWNLPAPDAAAVRRVRREIVAALTADAAPQGDLLGAELAVAEILNNAILHAPGPLSVRLDWSGAKPLVEVEDRGPGFVLDQRLTADADRIGGRGLVLAERVAERLRVEPREGGGARVSLLLALERLGDGVARPHGDA